MGAQTMASLHVVEAGSVRLGRLRVVGIRPSTEVINKMVSYNAIPTFVQDSITMFHHQPTSTLQVEEDVGEGSGVVHPEAREERLEAEDRRHSKPADALARAFDSSAYAKSMVLEVLSQWTRNPVTWTSWKQIG